MVRGDHPSFLSYKTAQEIKIIKIVEVVQATSGVNISEQFLELTRGIGELKQFQVKLKIKGDVTPVASPHRRIPFCKKKKKKRL